MTTIIECFPPAEKPVPDLKALKTKQQAAWSSGDYAIIGTTLQIVGENLAESMDLRAGQTLLDVAAGNGNATLAAAFHWNGQLIAFKDRLLAAGKLHKVMRVACARKLLIFINAVVARGTPWVSSPV